MHANLIKQWKDQTARRDHQHHRHSRKAKDQLYHQRWVQIGDHFSTRFGGCHPSCRYCSIRGKDKRAQLCDNGRRCCRKPTNGRLRSLHLIIGVKIVTEFRVDRHPSRVVNIHDCSARAWRHPKGRPLSAPADLLILNCEPVLVCQMAMPVKLLRIAAKVPPRTKRRWLLPFGQPASSCVCQFPDASPPRLRDTMQLTHQRPVKKLFLVERDRPSRLEGVRPTTLLFEYS